MEKTYLKCETTKGMFPQEYTVTAELYDETKISGFFDKRLVNEKGLEIKILEEEGDASLILIPNDGFLTDFNSKVIKVNNSELTTQKPDYSK